MYVVHSSGTMSRSCIDKSSFLRSIRRRLYDMTALSVLEWTGAMFGVLGALLLALHKPYSGWGFVAFLISNGCWLAFARLRRAPGLFVMQVFFTLISTLGVFTWFTA